MYILHSPHPLVLQITMAAKPSVWDDTDHDTVEEEEEEEGPHRKVITEEQWQHRFAQRSKQIGYAPWTIPDGARGPGSPPSATRTTVAS